MTKKPLSEVDLSPLVIKHFQELGYCVHGEVAIFKKSSFIDHVAHLGPCHKPTKVIAIEMKMGATKELRRQIYKLDSFHVADELWGVAVTNPRKSTLRKWKREGRWFRPGLLIWTEEGSLRPLQEPKEKRKYSRRMKKDHLLLFKGNKGSLAGYRSGDIKYHTHWSITKDHIENKIISLSDPVSEEDLWRSVSRTYGIKPYKQKKGAMRRMLKVLEEEESKIKRVKIGKKFHYKKARSL